MLLLLDFERGFATQTLSQSPKAKALLSNAFAFGLIKFTSLIRAHVNLTREVSL